MKDEIIEKIETKISELEGNLKKVNESLAVLSANIKSQILNKKNMESESVFLSGAIQAYKSITSEYKSTSYKELEKLDILEEDDKNV